MAFTGACHHLRCSFLSSRSVTAGFLLLNALSEDVTLNLLQSDGVAVPSAASWYVRRVRGTVSGPRPFPDPDGPWDDAVVSSSSVEFCKF